MCSRVYFRPVTRALRWLVLPLWSSSLESHNGIAVPCYLPATRLHFIAVYFAQLDPASLQNTLLLFLSKIYEAFTLLCKEKYGLILESLLENFTHNQIYKYYKQDSDSNSLIENITYSAKF